MTPSLTVELMGRVNNLKAQGEDIISLNAGEPDFDTPAYVTQACKKVLDEGKTRCTAVAGLPQLKRAICDHGQIVAATGAKQALYSSILADCDPGDEVIVISPCWVSHTEMVKMAGGVPVPVPADPATFQPDAEAIRQAITPRTRAIMLNTPNNPTGAVYTREAPAAIGELAVANDLYLISD